MFSTFTNLLPNLPLSNPFHAEHGAVKELDNADEANETNAETSAVPVQISVGPASSSKRRERKERNIYETFIIVRPPPAKSNHPLNLQVQLVPPTASRPPAIMTNVSPSDADDAASSSPGASSPRIPPPSTPATLAGTAPTTPVTATTTDGKSLNRTPSIGSSTSASYSTGTTAPASMSVSSLATNASASSTRRTIIPLYNLQAHNVMANVVVDAGTDSKIAKFGKRGMEIVALALLEPIEYWGSGTLGTIPSAVSVPLSVGSPRASIESPRPDSRLSVNVAADPHSLSLSPVLESRTPTPIGITINPPTFLAPPPTGSHKLFSKMFRKVGRPSTSDGTSDDDSASSKSAGRRGSGLFSRHGRSASSVSSANVVVPRASSPAPPTSVTSSSSSSAVTYVPAPVLGVQPGTTSDDPALLTGNGRPSGYIWIVRKWIKGSDSLISGVIGRLGSGHHHHSDSLSSIEVRVEWSKCAKPTAKKIVPRRTISNQTSKEQLSVSEHSPPRSNSAAGHNTASSTPNSTVNSRMRRRTSMISSSTHTNESDDEAAEDSDGEDTETPWACSLLIQRRRSSQNRLAPPLDGLVTPPPQEILRLKLATLSPTPHHPKVVAMFKVPYPLPDISIDDMVVYRRAISPLGSTLSTFPKDTTNLILTSEELKDIISCTSLWLVVREGLGGVGKDKRKGDGWAIRK